MIGSLPRRLVLIRHGRTALNREDRLRGLADPPLEELGLTQAAALVPHMEDLGLSVVHCSPLQRAMRTGAVVADALGISNLRDPRFTDRDYGPWTGRLREDVVERFGSVDRAPGVEPVEVVLARVRPALDALLDEERGVVAVVTHDAIIRPLIASIAPGAATPHAPNGSWNELRRDGATWSVETLDRLPDSASDQ